MRGEFPARLRGPFRFDASASVALVTDRARLTNPAQEDLQVQSDNRAATTRTWAPWRLDSASTAIESAIGGLRAALEGERSGESVSAV